MTNREIDALIAEKVMGLSSTPPECGHNYCVDVERPTCKWIPNYSTDISAAWEVFNKFECASVVKNHGGDFTARIEVLTKKTIKNYHKWWNKFDADADTAPMAICLAALKSKGIEV